MSVTAEQVGQTFSQARASDQPAPKVPWVYTIGLGIVVTVVVLIYRWFQQTHSFTVGLDYFEQAFQDTWMRLFYIQMSLIMLAGIIGVPAVWFTRERDLSAVTPQDELRRIYWVLSVAAVASVLVVIALGLFVEADAAWHQTTIRDTDFTPTHIALFYFILPAGFVGLIMGFVWIHTRIPYFANRVSVPLSVICLGLPLIMPNLGFNEWGHTFFYMEELFAAPIHWGFVTLAWAFFCLSGFTVQCLARMRELTTLPGQEKSALPS